MAASSSFHDAFGGVDLLVDGAGKRCSFPDLAPGGVVGLYFTAQCFDDGFMPTLVEFHGRYADRQQQPKQQLSQFEVVLVSLDDDKETFDELRAAAPQWKALGSYSEHGTAMLDVLRRRYHYRRLPSLILVDAQSGRMITDIGRQCVLADPEAANFPWSVPSLTAILDAGRLMNGSSSTVDGREALGGKLKALYFSSLDCAPCQEFTPLLAESYARIRSAGHRFEVLFVSGDESLTEFNDNYAVMPWLALPFGDIRTVQLESRFQVDGYPQLILLDEDNELITTEGCGVIMNDPKGWNFPWPIQHVEELHDDNNITLRFLPCLVLLTGGRENLINQAISLLAGIARDYHAVVKATRGSADPAPDLHFFYEGQRSADVVETLLDTLRLTVQRTPQNILLRPRVVLVDLKDDRYFVCWSDDNSSADAVTDDSLRHLANSYRTKTLALKRIPCLS